MNLFFSFINIIVSRSSIRHCKFTIILITVGEHKGDSVISRIGNVNLQTIRRQHRETLYGSASHRSNFHRYLPNVFIEYHRENMTIN